MSVHVNYNHVPKDLKKQWVAYYAQKMDEKRRKYRDWARDEELRIFEEYRTKHGVHMRRPHASMLPTKEWKNFLARINAQKWRSTRKAREVEVRRVYEQFKAAHGCVKPMNRLSGTEVDEWENYLACVDNDKESERLERLDEEKLRHYVEFIRVADVRPPSVGSIILSYCFCGWFEK